MYCELRSVDSCSLFRFVLFKKKLQCVNSLIEVNAGEAGMWDKGVKEGAGRVRTDSA